MTDYCNKTKRTALVLGGTKPHILLIEKLKARGYHVILVDYLEAPPGAPFANAHIRESTLDEKRVLQIAKDTDASLIISTCIDQANCTCCYVAEQLCLPKPYDHETALNVTDKGRMKRIMADNGIRTSPFITVHSVDEIIWDKVRYPAVVKPVDCNSSKGVHRADCREEVERFTQEALLLSRSGVAIIEGYNTGSEIQVDCLATEQGASVLLTRMKKRIDSSSGMLLQSTGSILPAPLSEPEAMECAEIAGKIAAAFHLNNTPFFYQAILTDQGISVLEFAPRIGGGLSYYLIEAITGVDIIECAIDSFLGIPIRVKKAKNDKVFSTCLLYMHPGVLDHIEGFSELKAAGIIREAFQLRQNGSSIRGDLRSGNRVGAMVIEAQDYNDLCRKERLAYDTIRLCDPSGTDLFNRTLYSMQQKGQFNFELL